MHQVITINSIGKLVLRLKSHYIEAQAGAREEAGEGAKIGPRAKACPGAGEGAEATGSASGAAAAAGEGAGAG